MNTGTSRFELVNAADAKGAAGMLGTSYARSRPLAGGIDLLDEMKEHIIEPQRLVNLKTIPGLDGIRLDAKGLMLGATVTLDEIESHPQIGKSFAALAQAARSVGTPQIRNVGTIGGNLCQRPRCWYYRDEEIICLKKGGSVCYAVEGDNRYNAILGGGPSYIVHPSDCAPALMALGASVTIQGPQNSRTVPLDKFFVLPTQSIQRENILAANEIVTAVTVPAPKPGTKSVYLKQKGRESFDWALASVACVLQITGGTVKNAALVLGGVAPIPWRAAAAEKLLVGQKLTPELAKRVADAALQGAKPLQHNAYKVPLTKALVRHALAQVGGINA
jgi:xanthine dehydrogenase YagS FAD-binding subunit